MYAGWEECDNTLYRKFEFADFVAAFAFMTKVAALAEEHDHHPDWCNSWNVVEITLCSHDKGRTVTSRDHQLAEAINKIIL
ncbi:MAG: 4a-hydroxytetrahydrobiopterin dehydratase [Actinomycetota bacterium]